MSTETGTCPFDGEVLTMPVLEQRETDDCIYVVMTDPGTVSRHLKDKHPAMWARMCEAQRQMNASPFIGGMPRKVNGTFLFAGEDVGDC